MKKLLFLLLIILLMIPISVSAEEITWTNTKTEGVGIELTAPQSFTTCIISPDGGSGYDQCTVYVQVYNNLFDINKDKLGFKALWSKNKVKNVIYEYSKDITPSFIIGSEYNEEFDVEFETYTPSYIMSNFSDKVPALALGESLIVRISFDKERWQSDSFNFETKFDTYTSLLDPDVSACGWLNTTGATYTLINTISSTSTCFKINANNITLDGNGYWINVTGSSYIVTSVNFKNVTIKNTKMNMGISGDLGTIIGIHFDNTTNSNIINNYITHNNTASPAASYWIDLDSKSNNTYVYNNSIVSRITNAITPVGILINSKNNTVIGGIFDINQFASDDVEYYLLTSNSINNTFINTNFSELRGIRLGNYNVFNYSDDGSLFVATNITSETNTIGRIIYLWTQSNVTWSDNVSTTTTTSYYNVTGLTPSADYEVYVNADLNYSLTSDSNGQLSLFSVPLTTTSQTIKVLYIEPPPVNYYVNVSQPISVSDSVTVSKIVASVSYNINLPSISTVNITSYSDAKVEGFGNPPIGSANYGLNTTYSVYTDNTPLENYERIYLSFNISSIPIGNNINNVKLFMYEYYGDDVGHDVGIYHVYNPINESTVTWDNQPCGSGQPIIFNTTNCNPTSINNLLTSYNNNWWNNYYPDWSRGIITSSVKSDYDTNKLNTTVLIKYVNENDAAHGVWFNSKDNVNSNLRPYLSIDYSSGPIIISDSVNVTKFTQRTITFNNVSISNDPIYVVTQPTIIGLNVISNESHYINNVSIGITYGGVETVYNMTNASNVTNHWTYSFTTGTTGIYSITHFYAMDNASLKNSTTSDKWFTAIIRTSDAGGGTGTITPTPTPNATVSPTPTATPSGVIIVLPKVVSPDVNDIIPVIIDNTQQTIKGITDAIDNSLSSSLGEPYNSLTDTAKYLAILMLGIVSVFILIKLGKRR